MDEEVDRCEGVEKLEHHENRCVTRAKVHWRCCGNRIKSY